ncbi:hypothetical protein [Zobellia sp. 1_MG-2023]|nr:hypothetical protein [Zobellia sp. 1_MG-2023]MDO6817927.1 hypothetical protein [Zobellia sp. 1_MG-2023]
MKDEVVKAATFICMFVVLGLQALMHGSWKVQEIDTLRNDRNKI